MKNKLKELDVDFIGGQQKPITKEEELAISDFIRKQKVKRQHKKLISQPKSYVILKQQLPKIGELVIN